MEDLQNVIEESLPEDVISESLPEGQEPEPNQEVSSEATEQQAETKEPPFNEHPRWKEVMEEKRVAQDRADRLEQQLLDISGKLATPKEQQVDPYADMGEEDKRFWKEVDRRAAEQAKRIAATERNNYMREQQATREQLAVIAYKEFQTKHPDVKSNSVEENAIAAKVKMGYNPDDAYEIVVGSAKRQALEEELAKAKQQKQKAKTTQKLAANLETSGIAPNSPIQPKGAEDVRSFIENYMKQEAAG